MATRNVEQVSRDPESDIDTVVGGLFDTQAMLEAIACRLQVLSDEASGDTRQTTHMIGRVLDLAVSRIEEAAEVLLAVRFAPIEAALPRPAD